MRKLFSIFAALTLSVGLWAADHYVPITIDANTLNGDVVMGKNQSANDVLAAGHAGKGLDNYACFYSNDCSYATDLDHGLPASVNVPNSEGVEVPFNFAWTGSGQFDGFDAIHLVSNGEAVTVDFKGGNAFKGLYFLATAGNISGGSSLITVTITYLDNTSKVSNFNILDWYYTDTKPTNAIQQFYRWYISTNSVNYKSTGPCLYCLSLNDALDPLKPIKSLTFTQANSKMCTAIFAITGILNGCTPQAPQNISGIYEGSTTKITFDAVTKDMDGNTITDEVTYVYDVARDPNFIKMLDGYTNQSLTTTTTDGKVTGTINAKLKGFYIRLRAKNTCGVSLNSDVIVDDDAEFFIVTIPESPDYFVPDYVPDARYLSGDQVTFTAQILSTLGKEFKGWINSHGTSMSTTSQVSFTITQDTTIMPNIERSYVQVPSNIATDKLVLVAGGISGINNEGSNIGSTHNGDKMYLYVNVDATQTQDYIFSFKSSNATTSAASCTVSVTQGGSPITLDKPTDNVPVTGGWGSYNNTHSFLMKNVAPGPYTICVQLTANGNNYAGNYKDFKVSVAPVYTRDVTDGSWGTLCLPWASIALEGGDFYDVLGTKHAEYGVALVELDESDQLTAGKPYVFKATSSQIKVTYNPATEVANPVVAGNHIIGSFAGCTVPKDMYIIYQDLLYKSNGANTIGANRAYFDADNMDPFDAQKAPARVVFMGGRQTPTELKVRDAQCTMHDGKYLINGQFVIIKDNKMYNAQGIEL